jgi:hypothetical protein
LQKKFWEIIGCRKQRYRVYPRARTAVWGNFSLLWKISSLIAGEIFPSCGEIFYFSGRFCTSASYTDKKKKLVGKLQGDFDPRYCFQISSIPGVLLAELARMSSPVFSFTSSVFMCFIFFFFYSSVFFATYIYRTDLISCIQ